MWFITGDLVGGEGLVPGWLGLGSQVRAGSQPGPPRVTQANSPPSFGVRGVKCLRLGEGASLLVAVEDLGGAETAGLSGPKWGLGAPAPALLTEMLAGGP